MSSAVNLLRWWPAMVLHHLGIISFQLLAVLLTSRQRGDGLIAWAFLMEFSRQDYMLHTYYLISL